MMNGIQSNLFMNGKCQRIIKKHGMKTLQKHIVYLSVKMQCQGY
jgi:hypothetical protein